MPTIKLVVIGASGVGKTSLRGQYISGRFTNGYRATIGADFITKTLPHPLNPAETVTLQIWDTAGQERFSSLSTAFFRGADAALLMFDVNTPSTMTALTKWWSEFRETAPLADEDVEDYCCVVAGNKVDLVGNVRVEGEEVVSEEEARRFLAELVPPTSSPTPHPGHLDDPSEDESEDDPLAPSLLTLRPPEPPGTPHAPSPSQPRSSSIAILPPNHHRPPAPSHSPTAKHHLPPSHSRSRSATRVYGDTMTTTYTTLTVYHTPSSSLFDVFHSARSSPEPWSSPSSSPSSPSPPSATSSPYASVRGRRLTTGSASSGSTATITPSLFAREYEGTAVTTPTHTTPEDGTLDLERDSLSGRGPKLFFTSAKTGEGVVEMFEYVVRRVVVRWEYEERVEARRMHFRESSGAESVRLGGRLGGEDRRVLGGCCGT